MVRREAVGPRPRLTLGSIGEFVGGRVVGDQGLEVTGMAPVDEAGEGQIAFLASRRYVRHVAGSRCAAYLVSAELEAELAPDMPRVVVDAPYAALRTLLLRLFPAEPAIPGVHPTAVIGRGVRFGTRVTVGPYAVLEDRVQVGDDVIIGAHSVLGVGSIVGARSRLYPHVVVYDGCVIGDDVIVHSGARLGADGFGYTQVDGEQHKMPQVGGCVIGNGVEIGANTTIDRGSLGDTVIGERVKIDNLVQIAHNVRVGADSLIAALVGVAGSTRIGKKVWLGGQAGVINQLQIGDGARVVVASTVMRDVPAGETVSGHPARPHREDLRRQAHLGRLSNLKRRVERLEEEMRRRSEG